MATSTTNLNLILPSGTDKIRIAQINSNMEAIDEAVGPVGNTSLQAQATATSQSLAKAQGGLAYIVGNTNDTGGTLAVGQFVYVKGHSTITEGLRKVTASISNNGNITTSNTSACSEGGLNALNSNLANLVKQVDVDGTTDASGNITTGVIGGCAVLALPIRNATGYYTSFYTVSICCPVGLYDRFVLHCVATDGTLIASTAVKIKLYYI